MNNPKYTTLEKMIRDYLADDIDTYRTLSPYVRPAASSSWANGHEEGYKQGLIAAAKFIRQDYSHDRP